MSFFAYMLRLSDGAYYVGHTEALEPRLVAHRLGMASEYTRRRRPVTLVWSQDFPTRVEALAAERQIKRWSRAKKEALIAGDWATVSWYALAPRERIGPPPPPGTHER